MKILVTGGAGYIGSHVVLHLCDKGYDVVVLDDLSMGSIEAVDDRAFFIEGSILNSDDLVSSLNGVDAVIHLAAFKSAGESMDNPQKYSENNVIGSQRLLSVMIENNVKKIIFSSSAAVYGIPEYLPLDEKHPLKPINHYGYTKLQTEKWLAKPRHLQPLSDGGVRTVREEAQGHPRASCRRQYARQYLCHARLGLQQFSPLAELSHRFRRRLESRLQQRPLPPVRQSA